MPTLGLPLYVDKHFASPCAMSVYGALQEKSLSFALQTVDLNADAQRQRDYAAASLTQRVPTLVHNGFALSESSAIAEYVDEVFPGAALYPTESAPRARARQIQAWLRSDFMPIRAERTTSVLFYEPTKAALSEEAKSGAAKLFAAVDQLLPYAGSHVAGLRCEGDDRASLRPPSKAMAAKGHALSACSAGQQGDERFQWLSAAFRPDARRQVRRHVLREEPVRFLLGSPHFDDAHAGFGRMRHVQNETR